jgi:replicative DNA helicase
MNVPAEAATEHDPEAECAVLGGVLLDSNVLPTVLDKLTPTDFCCEEHRLISRGCLDLHERGVALDLVTVRHHLEVQGLLKQVGGAVYLSSLVDALSDVANPESYAQIVLDQAVKREVMIIGERLQHEGSVSVALAVKRLEKKLDRLKEGR